MQLTQKQFDSFDSSIIAMSSLDSSHCDSSKKASSLDDINQSFSIAISTHIIGCASDNINHRCTSYDNLRYMYIAMMKEGCWQEVFNAANELIVRYYESSSSHSISHCDTSTIDEDSVINISIAGNDDIIEFNRSKHPVIIIGSHSHCDVVIGNDDFTSRIAAVIYCDVRLKQILVVDVGCLNGIETISRSNKEMKLESSVDKDRRVMVFEATESIVMNCPPSICGNKIRINPLICRICMYKARSITFNCGHFVSCSNCASTLISNAKATNARLTCPICRNHQPADWCMMNTNINSRCETYRPHQFDST